MSFYIRYAKENDAQALGLIYSQSYRNAFKDIIPDNILEDVFTPEKRADGLMRELREGNPTNVILLDEDKPIGLFTYGKPKDDDLDSDTVEIWRIYLLPYYWNKKVGVELMNWGINEIEKKGYKKIMLWVLAENNRARKFYEKLGFIYDGTLRVINPGKELKDLKYMKILNSALKENID